MKRMVTLASALKASSYGLVSLMLIDGRVSDALWGVVAAQIGTAITTWITKRAEFKQREQQHAWDREDREAKAIEAKADVLRAQQVVSSQIEKVGERADRAYDAGNHATEKIAALASRPVVVTLSAPVATDQTGTPA